MTKELRVGGDNRTGVIVMKSKVTRRGVLKGSSALALSLASTRVLSAAPAAEAVTPELIAAAKKEGKEIGRAHV